MKNIINIVIKNKFYSIFLLIILSLGIFYVKETYSPSSYGIVLEKLNVKDRGTVFGVPREIRSDEWSVVTSLTKAAVNSNFSRQNITSVYKEDFRINYGIPIKDWGAVFKPTMLLYFFTNAAYAFSFHWYSIMVIFILGYYFLARKLELSKINSLLFSIGLYFTGYVQFWWNEKGPIFAFFPWVILVLLWDIPEWLSLVLFYWLGTSWLITNFYPPIFLSLGFVIFLIFIIYGKKWFNLKKLLLLCLTAVLIGTTVFLYLRNYLILTMNTVYPGKRASSGGGMDILLYISNFFPYINFNNNYDTLIKNSNISETGTVGTYLILMLLCFSNYTKEKIKLLLKDKTVIVFSIGLLLMTIWLFFPIPSYIGKIFLWDRVPSKRMLYAYGVLLMLLTVYIFNKMEMKINLIRTLIFIGITIVLFYYFKVLKGQLLINNTQDFWIIPVFLIMFIIYKLKLIDIKTMILSVSTITGMLVLVYFNPIQKAWPIFNREKTEWTRYFDEEAKYNETIVIPGAWGAVLNGLGYKSISHVTAVPALWFWKERYPEISEEKFNLIFNRYSHIQIFPDREIPQSPRPDVVLVPLEHFLHFRDNEIVTYIDSDGKNKWPEFLEKGRVYKNVSVAKDNRIINTFGIQIGNNQNKSDGIMKIKVCSLGKCVTGEKDLKVSLDAMYFSIPLSQELEIKQGQHIEYEVEVIGNTAYPPAIWVYTEHHNKPNLRLSKINR